MTTCCFAAKAKGANLENYEYTPQALQPYDIDVDITHCGICRSDIHLIDNDWNTSTYPLIPGHEIIGIVTGKGNLVPQFQIGDRVGIGWQRSSCFSCEWCMKGEENLCAKQQATCVGHQGGFAKKIRTDSRFAFHIPDALTSENAAPLLCGGATVYSPFIEHQIAPTSRVAIIGVGGLGHLAIQFSNAFGHEVTVFSHSADKKQEAFHFGAHHFVDSTDEKAVASLASSFDFILCTISQPINCDTYLSLLRPKGILCFVGAQQKPLSVQIFSLLPGRKSVASSNIASRSDMNDMLRFAARHQIKAQVELFAMDEVNKAIERVRCGEIRYRAVLTNYPTRSR